MSDTLRRSARTREPNSKAVRRSRAQKRPNGSSASAPHSAEPAVGPANTEGSLAKYVSTNAASSVVIAGTLGCGTWSSDACSITISCSRSAHCRTVWSRWSARIACCAAVTRSAAGAKRTQDTGCGSGRAAAQLRNSSRRTPSGAHSGCTRSGARTNSLSNAAGVNRCARSASSIFRSASLSMRQP